MKTDIFPTCLVCHSSYGHCFFSLRRFWTWDFLPPLQIINQRSESLLCRYLKTFAHNPKPSGLKRELIILFVVEQKNNNNNLTIRCRKHKTKERKWPKPNNMKEADMWRRHRHSWYNSALSHHQGTKLCWGATMETDHWQDKSSVCYCPVCLSTWIFFLCGRRLK